MIILLSPAKTLDFTPSEKAPASMPRLLADSEKLVKTLKQKSAADIQSLMKVSEKIATLNVERYQSFSTPFTEKNAKAALLAFKGDVYRDLDADSLDEEDLKFAQQHVRILSGLYGVLRPMDLMQPYRLEMGTKLQYGDHKNLYQFWGNKITELINQDLEKSNSNIILNLASKEYFKSINTKKLQGQLVNVDFKEFRNDQLKTIAFNAKRARGAMTRDIVRLRLEQPQQLKELNINGYEFNEGISSKNHLVFTK